MRPTTPAVAASPAPTVSFAQFFTNTPLAIAPQALHAIHLAMGQGATAGSTFASKPSRPAKPSYTALIPLMSVLFPRGNFLTDMGYGTALDEVSIAVQDAVEDPSVSRILLYVDSPGGSVYGVAELADVVAAAAKKKPVVAMVDSVCASAAYWIASNASEIVITPGGELGSIGVYLLHMDVSGAMAQAGKKATFVSAGEKKVAGHQFGPLDDAGRAEMEATVNDYYGQFTRAVARGRNVAPSTVRNGFGRGGMVRATEAVNTGMADRIAPLDQVLSESPGGIRVGSSSASRASVVTSGKNPEIEIRKRRMLIGASSTPNQSPAKVSPVEPPADDLRETAYHEAGHAVVATLLQVAFTSVSIVPDSESKGRLSMGQELRLSSDVDIAAMCFAGVMAGNLAARWMRNLSDTEPDAVLARRYCPDSRDRDLASSKALRLVKANRAAIENVAASLLFVKTLTASQVRSIVGGAVAARC